MKLMVKPTALIAGAAIAFAAASPLVAQETAPATETPSESPAEMQHVTADTVVATVNGEDITIGHLVLARASLPQQYQALPNDVLFDGLIDQLIQQDMDVSSGELSDRQMPPGGNQVILDIALGAFVGGRLLVHLGVTLEKFLGDGFELLFALFQGFELGVCTTTG